MLATVGSDGMEWLALSIAFLGTIYFAIHYRGFRRGLLYVVGGLAGLGVIGGLVAWYNNHQSEERRRVASTLIEHGQIEIADAKLSLGITSELSAVVTNRSGHDLAELSLKVIVTDCPRNLFADLIPPQPPSGFVLDPKTGSPEKSRANPFDQFDKSKDAPKCGIVGQDLVRAYSIDVPRGQKRAFKAYVSLRNLPEMKEWSWHYTIEQIVAKH